MNQNNNDFYFFLSYMANILQIADFQMNVKQISNDELLKYLEHQDQDFLKTIVEQNVEIIKQNEKIIELLTKGEKEDA